MHVLTFFSASSLFKPDEDLQYIVRKFVIKIFALKNFKINNHQNVSRAFNILHYNNLLWKRSSEARTNLRTRGPTSCITVIRNVYLQLNLSIYL